MAEILSVHPGVYRFDRGEVGAISRTPQGFLRVPAFVTRTGVFPYRLPDGTIRYELRHPDEVFTPESLDSLKGAPFTVEHPPEMITPDNVAMYRKGHAGERVEVNRDLVETDLTIEDRDAIDAVVKDGLREISAGYVADVIEEAGVYNGTPYTHRQVNIRYNHVAGVMRGRAGPEVRLRMDSEDAIMDSIESNGGVDGADSARKDADLEPEAPRTKRVVVSGEEIELPSRVADVVQQMMDRYDEMRARLMALEETSLAKKNDVDVSQSGVSPTVPVEQGIPDGRAAGAKADADKDKDEKGDADGADKDKKDADEVSQLKKDIEQLRKDADEKQAKLDEFAASSMGKGEKKTDSADAGEARVRARVKLERTAEKLVTVEVANKFDSMSDDEIRSAVIQAKHPKADLAGKSTVYLQTRFDSIVESIEEGGAGARREAGAALLSPGARKWNTGGRGQARFDANDVPDPSAARQKAIESSRTAWQEPLSGTKK